MCPGTSPCVQGTRSGHVRNMNEREDDRNEEVEDSPVPDPETADGDTEDVPEAD